MAIFTLFGTADNAGSVRTRLATAFGGSRKIRAGVRGGAISDHLLRDIGVTPYGVRETALAARNEARR